MAGDGAVRAFHSLFDEAENKLSAMRAKRRPAESRPLELVGDVDGEGCRARRDRGAVFLAPGDHLIN